MKKATSFAADSSGSRDGNHGLLDILRKGGANLGPLSNFFMNTDGSYDRWLDLLPNSSTAEITKSIWVWYLTPNPKKWARLLVSCVVGRVENREMERAEEL